MICVVVPGPTIAKTRKILAELPKEVNLVEMRLDLIEDWTLLNLQQLRDEFPELNVIYTLRPIDQGGGSAMAMEDRMEILRELSKSNPQYIDIEYGTPPDYIKAIKKDNPNVNIILSYHNFSETPNLNDLYAQMKKVPADLYKIACHVNSTTESLKMLLFMRANPGTILSGIGIYGRITRILAPVFGGVITYASFDDNSSVVPGQLSASELLDKYNFNTLDKDTKIYALIGEPIDRSPSTTVYNALMKKRNLHAVYVKFPLKEDTLPEFIELIKQMPVYGLSITSPVKELMFKLCCEENDPDAIRIAALNTVVKKDGKFYGYTTDGLGAAEALEKYGPVAEKKMLIIGAGGAVKSVIIEALKRGVIVIILNRTLERAQKIAQELNCFCDTLDNIKLYYLDGYDILVNGTTVQPIEDQMILPGTIVFDIQILPTDTKLLAAARKKGCKIINGYEMWINQGSQQCYMWFGWDPAETKKFMQASLKKMWDLPDF